jgi:hypothetical protein
MCFGSPCSPLNLCSVSSKTALNVAWGGCNVLTYTFTYDTHNQCTACTPSGSHLGCAPRFVQSQTKYYFTPCVDIKLYFLVSYSDEWSYLRMGVFYWLINFNNSEWKIGHSQCHTNKATRTWQSWVAPQNCAENSYTPQFNNKVKDIIFQWPLKLPYE